MITINFDDTTYFGGNVNQNHLEVGDALNPTKEDISTLVKNSLRDNNSLIELKEEVTYYRVE
ncbi:MAG TPA: hypothetical protein VLZ33_06155 [Dysgonamonadaceae bacterium]|nr:hypothetical protein [Dysgonamonadaceae bacterium]